MKINDILDQELKNSEFAKEFYADKKNLLVRLHYIKPVKKQD
ncbi:MAG: hypothetical protein ACIRZZ_01490 [Lactobacillus gallinarum]